MRYRTSPRPCVRGAPLAAARPPGLLLSPGPFGEQLSLAGLAVDRLAEQVGVLRLRRPVDPMELHDWLQQGTCPLYDAWSSTWVSSSPAMVTRGNAVIDACTGVLDAVSERAPARGPARLREAIVGRGADKDQEERLRAAIHALAMARRDYAELVRKETGKDPAELFFRAPE